MGGNILVWKNNVTNLLSFSIITGFGFPQNIGPYSLKAKNIVRNSLVYMNILNCVALKVLEPQATRAKAFRVDVYSSSGSSSTRTAYPAAWKLASVMRAICLLGSGCLSDSSQHRSRALVNFSNRSGVTRIFSSFFNSLKNGVNFGESLGI